MSSPIYCPIDGASKRFSFRRGARLADKHCPVCGGPMKLARWLVPKHLLAGCYWFEVGYADARAANEHRHDLLLYGQRAYDLGWTLGSTALHNMIERSANE